MKINVFKEMQNDSIINTRNILNNANEKQLKLVRFALKENNLNAAKKDLKVLFDEKESNDIVTAFRTSPNKVVEMLQSGKNHLIIQKEQRTKAAANSYDKSRPYVGQILQNVFGYDCTLVEFYQVTKVTKCFVWVRKLKKEMVENIDGYGQKAMYRPVRNKFIDGSKTLRRKIFKDRCTGYSISVDGYTSAQPWGGQDIYEDTCD